MGARTGLEAIGRAVANEQSPITPLLRPIMLQLLDEIRVLEARVAQLEPARTTGARIARLVRAHFRGELLRHYASLGTHLQDGRSLPHVTYPRRALSAAGSQSRTHECEPTQMTFAGAKGFEVHGRATRKT